MFHLWADCCRAHTRGSSHWAGGSSSRTANNSVLVTVAMLQDLPQVHRPPCCCLHMLVPACWLHTYPHCSQDFPAAFSRCSTFVSRSNPAKIAL